MFPLWYRELLKKVSNMTDAAIDILELQVEQQERQLEPQKKD